MLQPLAQVIRFGLRHGLSPQLPLSVAINLKEEALLGTSQVPLHNLGCGPELRPKLPLQPGHILPSRLQAHLQVPQFVRELILHLRVLGAGCLVQIPEALLRLLLEGILLSLMSPLEPIQTLFIAKALLREASHLGGLSTDLLKQSPVCVLPNAHRLHDLLIRNRLSKHVAVEVLATPLGLLQRLSQYTRTPWWRSSPPVNVASAGSAVYDSRGCTCLVLQRSHHILHPPYEHPASPHGALHHRSQLLAACLDATAQLPQR
mmetsp:Transcript_68361/g.138993  ORF Transcript_68361/g.138993 Transcript_68361/m.138993 type:complete len:261 (-) Transcript_68361:67-849(-)